VSPFSHPTSAMCHPRPVDLSHRPQPVASPSPHRCVTLAALSHINQSLFYLFSPEPILTDN
jgi:hypothetical protein